MNPSSLLALQDIDTALDGIVNKRPRLPEVAAHQSALAALAQLRARMAAAQLRIDKAQASIDAAEHAAGDLTKKRARLEAQLKTVIAPREAEALMHEITTVNGHRSDLDDQELAAIEEQADAETVLAVQTEQLPEHEEILSQAKMALDAALAELAADEAGLREQRGSVLTDIGAEEHALYDRVRKQFGGVGVAHLVGSHCSGCHMDLSPRELDVVKAVPAGSLAECPQCGRIIVR